MKSHKKLTFSTIVMSAVLMAATVAWAQNGTNDAEKSFDEIKTLAGNWQGAVTINPPMKDVQNGSGVKVSLRVTSRGNAMVHEMGDPMMATEDPTKHDHPVTMFYLDNGQLLLTHYCDAGNRPRMVAKASPDGKTLDFDFLDVAGPTNDGHMQHATFTIVDDNHHVEEWTYLMPGDKPMHARIELQRVK